MGWTGLEYQAPKTIKQEREFFSKEFTFTTSEGESSEVVAASKVGSVWYMAVKVTNYMGAQSNHYDCDDDYTFGVVIMTRRIHGEFLFKEIIETSGPADSEAPRKVLNKLSDLSDDASTSVEWASNWRKRCDDNIVNNAQVKTIKQGDKIKLVDKVTFGGVEVDEFLVTAYSTRRGQTRRCYSNPKVGMVRLDKRHLVGAVVT